MSLSAVSFASEPELQNIMCPIPRGATPAIFVASSIAGSVVVLKNEQ
jgi:hypothetical protein